MNKIAAIILALILVLSLAACQDQSENAQISSIGEIADGLSSSETRSSGALQPEAADRENVLIACFTLGRNADYPDDIDAITSASLVLDSGEMVGTTEYAARLIQDCVGGDIHLIQTKTPYPADYETVIDQNHEEMNAGTFPELEEDGLDVSQYDTVFIGYPVWATNAPQAIYSFLSKYDLSGKTVIPFCTHAGYGAGNSYGDIAEAIDGEEAVPEGLAIEASNVPSAADTVAQWLQRLGLTSQAAATAITITVGDTVLDGVLYDTALANEIRGYFPLTIPMTGFGGREYYGGVDFFPENLEVGQKTFENGDITYCDAHHNMAVFYAQTDNPILSVEVIPIGRVTSSLTVFHELQGGAEITLALTE